MASPASPVAIPFDSWVCSTGLGLSLRFLSNVNLIRVEPSSFKAVIFVVPTHYCSSVVNIGNRASCNILCPPSPPGCFGIFQVVVGLPDRSWMMITTVIHRFTFNVLFPPFLKYLFYWEYLIVKFPHWNFPWYWETKLFEKGSQQSWSASYKHRKPHFYVNLPAQRSYISQIKECLAPHEASSKSVCSMLVVTSQLDRRYLKGLCSSYRDCIVALSSFW